jgi:hydroxymethylpyrimidine pyrophosphatase-like HAD family hydrolase
MNIKLIALDMDGTLLDSKKNLPPDFIPWVKSHPEIMTVIASGRQYHTLAKDFYLLKNELIFIAENGGLVLKNDEIIQLSNGMKVVVHSQWGDDFDKFLKVAKKLFNVTLSDNGYILDTPLVVNEGDSGTSQAKKDTDFKEDKRIGYIVRLFPSQHKGEIVRVRKDSKGMKKLVVKTTSGDTVEVDDLPYLYEVLKRK